MFRHLLAGSILLSAVSASAAPEWVQLADAQDNTVSYVDRGSIGAGKDGMSVWVLRSYGERVALGRDPVTGKDIYPHRSVKVRYMVQCNSGKVAMDRWAMFSGNLGDGEIVWVDQVPGERTFLRAGTDEERFALGVTCAVKAAAEQRAGKLQAQAAKADTPLAKLP